MIARMHNTNGHTNGSTWPSTGGHADSGSGSDLLDHLFELDWAYFERRQEREAVSTYAAGTADRMNPVPQGIDPLGTDADYHYRTERNYFLMVERGRAAVRSSTYPKNPRINDGLCRRLVWRFLLRYNNDHVMSTSNPIAVHANRVRRLAEG